MGEILLCGDFNARTSNLIDFIQDDDNNENINECPIPSNYCEDFPIPRNQLDQTKNLHGKLLIDICRDFQMRILNGRFLGDSLGYFTFYNSNGQSIVDYMIATSSIFYDINYFIVHSPVEFSDHCLISLYMKSNIQRKITQNPNKTYIGQYKWDENVREAYKDALLEKDSIDNILTLNSLIEDDKFEDIDTLVSNLNNIYIQAASKTLIFKRPRRPKNKSKNVKPKKPWMSNNCLMLRREVRSLGKKLQKDPKNIWIRNAYHTSVREYNKLKKQLKNNFFSSLIDNINEIDPNNSKQFWSSLKKIKKDKTESLNSITESEWVEHYKSLLTNNQSPLNKEDSAEGKEQIPTPLDYPFTCNEVKKGVKRLKNSKKEGTDLILNEFIKVGNSTLILTIVNLFNKILKSGKFPKIWNHTLISSIFKSGDPNDCNNYRGISVTSCVGKLFTSLLQRRLSDYLENKELLSFNQGGFRSGYRTTDHIFILKTLINKYLDNHKKKLYFCFVDFKKAFDSVNRNKLFQKIERKGIGGNFLNIIKDMYFNTLYSCKFGDTYSEPFLANLGVKQGDSLSPTLFNIFVDDIDSVFDDQSKTNPVRLHNHTFNHLLYADDLVIISESPLGLQNCINSLGKYCEKWDLKINTKKTKVMTLGKKIRNNSKSQLSITFNNKTLESVDQYKYLGITFTNNGKLKYAPEVLALKARKAFFALKTNIPSSENLSVQKWIKLYESMIVPILTYGSEIWIADQNLNLDNLNKFTFEKTQNMILKHILGVHNKTSTFGIQMELSQYPLCFKAFKLMFKYYKRLLEIESSKEHVYDLLRSAFEEDKNLKSKNTSSWIKSVENFKTLFNLDSLEKTHIEFEKEIKSYFSKKLLNELSHIKNSNTGKLRFFSQITKDFELQDYLKFNINKHLRSKLTKLRLSAHSLAIETGRYSKPITPAEERFCKSCKSKVEDELHFLLDCPIYNKLRDKFFTLFNKNLNGMNDTPLKIASSLLNPTTIQDTKNICLYLQESFSIRDKFLKQFNE